MPGPSTVKRRKAKDMTDWEHVGVDLASEDTEDYSVVSLWSRGHLVTLRRFASLWRCADFLSQLVRRSKPKGLTVKYEREKG